MSEKIFLSSPHMSDEGYEKEFIQEAFDTNWIAPLGANVDNFESEFALKINMSSAAALSAGTAAIHMALKALEIKQNDIVFCQSLTFAASVNPVMYEKGTPVFIDSDYETWCMDPKALKLAFEKYKALDKMPKAVIVVYLYGLSAKIDEIVALCKEYNVPLIEDAAEALGTKYKGQYTGTFGDYGIFSFNGNKIITTSGGGMLVSNNVERIKKVRFWSTQARDVARHYEHSEIGYNYRMSNIVAGIGRGQLKVLDQRVQQKKAIYAYYESTIGKLDGLTLSPTNDFDDTNRWLSCMLIDAKCQVKPLDVMLALEADNIESRPIWKPMHLQPIFKMYDYIQVGKNSVSEDIFNRGVCLPSDTKMTTEEMQRVSTAITNLWK